MYRIDIGNASNLYDYEEMIKVFLKPGEYEIVTGKNGSGESEISAEANDAPDSREHKNAVKRKIYSELSEITGMTPPWGILTGVRPVKLTGELFDKLKDKDAVKSEFMNEYLLSEKKADLLIETYLYQQQQLGKPDPASLGLYIGIPFCPTRCLYCSFTSNQKPESEIARYLEALEKEIIYCGRRMKETGVYPESVYIGGGTPTTLSAAQLDWLLTLVKDNIDLSKTREFTVEAGRPDTITIEKLRVIKDHGVGRISINPQSMKQETLEIIGRNHTPAQIEEAFQKANSVAIPVVNCDIIAGLPGETPRDFKNTLIDVLRLGPMNVTVHTLAVKRASRLAEADKDYSYRHGDDVAEMLGIGEQILRANGFRPYYLYRQKHMAGSFENVGWSKDDTPSVYNIRIMEEKQSILALGAGGISKIFFPEENRLERVANVSNYEIYIDRLEEMLERKEQGFFGCIRR